MGNNIDIPASGGGSGAVVAVKSVTKTDTQSTTSSNGTWVDVTGLSITYTPTSASNKVLVLATLVTGATAVTNTVAIRLVRDSTAIGIGDAASSRLRVSTVSGWTGNANGEIATNCACSVLDNPATTASTTWKVQFCAGTGGAGTAYINRTDTDSNAAYEARGASTLTIMEVTP